MSKGGFQYWGTHSYVHGEKKENYQYFLVELQHKLCNTYFCSKCKTEILPLVFVASRLALTCYMWLSIIQVLLWKQEVNALKQEISWNNITCHWYVLCTMQCHLPCQHHWWTAISITGGLQSTLFQDLLSIFIQYIGTPLLLTLLVLKFERPFYYLISLKLQVWVANSLDLDQMPQFVASDLGLHCLLRSVCPNT